MATGRKGPPAPPPRKRLSGPADGGSPDESDPGAASSTGGGGGGVQDDLVAVVRGLAAAVAEHGLTELVVDTPEVTFTLRRGGASATVAQVSSMPMQQVPVQSVPMHSMPMHSMASMQIPTIPMGASMASIAVPPPSSPSHSGVIAVPPVAPPPPVEEKVHVVTSPFVGTFYRRPNPDAAEYVKINDKVGKGQVLCLVEAMKLMNEIESDVAGTIVGVLAEDGAPVEYGQALFKIAPS